MCKNIFCNFLVKLQKTLEVSYLTLTKFVSSDALLSNVIFMQQFISIISMIPLFCGCYSSCSVVLSEVGMEMNEHARPLRICDREKFNCQVYSNVLNLLWHHYSNAKMENIKCDTTSQWHVSQNYIRRHTMWFSCYFDLKKLFEAELHKLLEIRW